MVAGLIVGSRCSPPARWRPLSRCRCMGADALVRHRLRLSRCHRDNVRAATIRLRRDSVELDTCGRRRAAGGRRPADPHHSAAAGHVLATGAGAESSPRSSSSHTLNHLKLPSKTAPPARITSGTACSGPTRTGLITILRSLCSSGYPRSH